MYIHLESVYIKCTYFYTTFESVKSTKFNTLIENVICKFIIVYILRNCVGYFLFIFFFENMKLCRLNIQNYVLLLKNWVYWIYTIVTFSEKLCLLNVKNSMLNSILSLKNCMCWIYIIVYIHFLNSLKICVRWMYTIENLCMINVQNFVIHWKIVYVKC